MAGGNNFVLSPEDASYIFGLKRAWLFISVPLKSHIGLEAVLVLSLCLNHSGLLHCPVVLASEAPFRHLLEDHFAHLVIPLHIAG